MDKLDKCFLIFSIVCFFMLGFSISQTIGTAKVDKIVFEASNKQNSIPDSELDIINKCKNLSIRESAYCLRDEIESFYIYNITDDEIAKNMTLEQIKEFGTDCTGWAYLYERLASGLGFESDTNRYDGIKGVHSAHRWAEIWDIEEGKYCELDLLNVKCYDIK